MIHLKKTFIKTVFKDLKKNLSRFVAIIAIVALGVGFLIGLLSATPDLQYSLNSFYKEQNTYDIQIKSTVGFSKNDVDHLKEDITQVADIEAYHQEDVEFLYDGVTKSARVIEQTFSEKINQLTLLSGRLPQKEQECIVLNKGIFADKDVLNETIHLNGVDYQVVGVCSSAVYYYKLMEPTTIGNGNLDTIIYIPQSKDSVLTDLVLTVQNASQKDCFKDTYFDWIAPVEEQLNDLKKSYLNQRIEELKAEAFDEGYALAIEKLRNQLTEMNIPEDRIQQMLVAQDEKIKTEVQNKVESSFADVSAEWYILNRKSNTSYVSFKDNSNKVNDVAVVFPFFFFFIAGLIALTSITRMVSEDRANIGTLKSLGYANHTILSKYLFYALISCLLGSLIGIFSGVYILPIVIYNCYHSLFWMPPAQYLWSAPIILISSIAMSLTITIVMILLCVKTLRERPNSLLAPKAPKPGKRILLERIGIFWKALKFRYKSALRNIFRFKRNLIMMIVGIGGCTGLMIVAFGLSKSMNSFSKLQYDSILKYDFIVDTSQQEMSFPMLTDSSTYAFNKATGRMKKDDDYEVQIYHVNDTILDYMDLGVTKLPEEGVLISKQLSQALKLKKKDSFFVDDNGEEHSYEVAGTFENYIGNYIIVPQQELEKTNAYFIKLGNEDKKDYEEIVKEIYDLDHLTRVEDIRQTRINYDSMAESVTIIIFVIILCSGALAMIVIYNLTNININERIKEIATLKVIGYQKKEVLGYIYREIITMSVFGILFGFILGPILDYFVMTQISSPGQYFSNGLMWYHFLFAFLISIAFVVLVLLMFIPKVKKIKMVESLKCIE